MHIAIDDTYGPNNINSSRYITNERRTSVAIVFEDNDVDSIRNNIEGCLSYIRNELNVNADELHFTEIYNRRGPWSKLNDSKNIRIIEAFAHIYSLHKWPVHVQTIDDRTLSDHGIKTIVAKLDSLDLSDKAQLSLAFLLIKIKTIYLSRDEPLTLFVDEGIGKAGKPFGDLWFRDWPQTFIGNFESSVSEPLLQLADFLAFSINRVTYLSTKQNRTSFDVSVLNLLSTMEINSPDIVTKHLDMNFTTQDVDKIHDDDRKRKGLKIL